MDMASESCVDKNIQVVCKRKKPHRHRSGHRKTCKKYEIYQQQGAEYGVQEQHNNKGLQERHNNNGALEHHKHSGTQEHNKHCGTQERHKYQGRHRDKQSHCKTSTSSDDNSYDEELNRMHMVRNTNKQLRRRNSDISDYVTVMAMQTHATRNAESMTSASRKFSVSQSNITVNPMCANINCPTKKEMPYTFKESDEDRFSSGGGIETSGGVCAHCRGLLKSTCPFCSRGGSQPKIRNKKPKNINDKKSCCVCNKRTSTDNGDKGRFISEEMPSKRSSMEPSGRCPSCGLFTEDCANLRLSPSEEDILLERERTRCDCKTKLLKQRLLKAFNVCPKCRQTRMLCTCLEEMIMEYKVRDDAMGGSSRTDMDRKDCCVCDSGEKDELEKLLQEVTDTCPKCGHNRKSCTCLEEMLWDVKRMLTKQNIAYEKQRKVDNNRDTSKKSCGCQCSGRKRGGNKDVFYQGAIQNTDSPLDLGCRGLQAYPVLSQETSPHLSKNFNSELEIKLTKICPDCKKTESSCGCPKEVPICNHCKLPSIICECKLHSKTQRDSDEFNSKALNINKTHRKNISNALIYCNCSIDKIAYDLRKVSICEQCLRPEHNCVCKQSPMCGKCGKRRGEEFEMKKLQQSREIEFASDRSQSMRTTRQETRSAREARPCCGQHTHKISCQPSAELVRSREPVGRSNESIFKRIEAATKHDGGTKYITVSHQTEDKAKQDKLNETIKNYGSDRDGKKYVNGTWTSQTAFQRLRSHFLRCRNCGKKHNNKKEYECRQVECHGIRSPHMSRSPDNKDTKKRDKSKKSEHEAKDSPERDGRKGRTCKVNKYSINGGVDVILPPQEAYSDDSLPGCGQGIVIKNASGLPA